MSRREEVKRGGEKEVSDASWCGQAAFQSKDPVVEGGHGMSSDSGERWMKELFIFSWVSGLFVNNLGWSEDMESSTQEEHTPSSNEDLMEGVSSAEDNDAVKEAVSVVPTHVDGAKTQVHCL